MPGSTRPIAAIGAAGLVPLLGLWWLEGRREKIQVDVPARSVRPWVLGAAGLAGVLFAAHLLLFAPVDDKLPCGQPIRLNAAMAYPLNCDSGLFMELARHPGALLESNSLRQSRPGYVALGAAATAIVGPIAAGIGLNDLYAQSDTAYVPLVLINLLVSAAALALFLWLLLRLGAPIGVIVALGAMFAINDVTKAYYWSPHQQMFSLLVPVGTIIVCRGLLLHRPSWKRAGILGLSLGVIMLVYGSLVITIAAAALAMLLSAPWRSMLPKVFAFGAIAAAPTIAWIAICRAVTGTYYNHEIAAYRQFVWLPESAAAGWATLLAKLRHASAMTASQLIEVTWLPFLVLALLCAAAVLVAVRLGPTTAEHRAIAAATILTGVVTLVFLWGMGLWAYRITFHLVPVILVAIALVAARLSARSTRSTVAVQLCLGLLATGWVTFELVSHGPYS